MSALFKKLAALSLGLMLGSSVLAEKKSYKIDLTREVTKGYKYNVVSTGKSTKKVLVLMNGQPVKKDDKLLRFSFDADCTVTEVNKDKKLPSKLLLEINKFIVFNKDAKGKLVKKELLPKGTKVTVYGKNKGKRETVYEIDGKPVDKNIKEIFSNSGAIDIYTGGATNNETLGSKQDRKIGESWKIDIDRAIKDAKESSDIFKNLSKKDIKGKVSLLDEVKVGETPCLKMGCRIKLRNVALPLPPMFKVKKAEMEVNTEGLFPLDTSKQLLKDVKEMEMEVEASGRQNPQAPLMTMKMKGKSTATSIYKPL